MQLRVLSVLLSCVLYAVLGGSSVSVTVFNNGDSTGGMAVDLTEDHVSSGLALAAYLSTIIEVDGVYTDETKTSTKAIADRVFTGKGLLVQSFEDIQPNDRLYVVAPGLLFVWPFVEFGHRVAIESRQSPTGKPIVIESFSDSPRVFLIHDFFSNEEADGLIKRVLEIDNEQKKLQRSGVGHESGRKTQSAVRTSENAFDGESPIAIAMNTRAFDLLNIGDYVEDMADGLQLLRYQQKQAYIPHTDYFDIGTAEKWNWDPKDGGSNRFATVFLYLSNVTRGGQTVFPFAEMPAGIDHPASPSDDEMTIFEKGSWEYKMTRQCYSKMASYPRKTGAVLFYSQKGNGALDPMSEHGGCPVLEGTKWAANLWVWNKRRYGLDGHKLSFDFVNNLDVPVELFWSTTWMYQIPPRSTKNYLTYDDHEWTIKDPNGNVLVVHRAKNEGGDHQVVTVPVVVSTTKDEL
ncbi:Aste57867_7534 [Aphanomyces stellatus]|uniref:Aste57867_7534 protein n=1 Tax=Aphanomyces stellatus TaxID=120398 RepID=A0A485KIH1_9STRA|nr:hypothetical protein As57867_007508 [Aphanomyces stellatus]VFT84443.1 Aste57867_7534 [Aphanomyces stellatus]